MGSSLSVKNELAFPIHVELKQTAPLHRVYDLQPGDTHKFECGKVWFTVGVYAANQGNKRFIDETAQGLSLAGTIVGAVAVIPASLPVSAVLGAAGIGLSVGGMVHAKQADPLGIVGCALSLGGMGMMAAQLAKVPILSKSIINGTYQGNRVFMVMGDGKTILRPIPSFSYSPGPSVGAVIDAGMTVVDISTQVAAAIKDIVQQSDGCMAFKTGVYADGYLVRVVWNHEEGKVEIIDNGTKAD